MNTRYFSLLSSLLSLSIIAPTLSVHAQDAPPVTPSQLHAQLAALVAAGYRPVGNDIDFPRNIIEAELHVASTRTLAATSGYGLDTSTSTQAGAAITTPAVSH